MNASRTRLGRIGTPQDVAKVIRFLLGDEAASGQTIVVNGGFLAVMITIGQLSVRPVVDSVVRPAPTQEYEATSGVD